MIAFKDVLWLIFSSILKRFFSLNILLIYIWVAWTVMLYIQLRELSLVLIVRLILLVEKFVRKNYGKWFCWAQCLVYFLSFLEKVEVIVNFPSEKFMINNILVILANCILIISTILLNAVSIKTILKCSQLKSKPCYFIILVQSFIDLAVGVFAIPLFVTFLASQVNWVSNCVAAFISLRLAFPPLGASIITLSALTIKRYIAILHPYSYIKLVTKKIILIYVASGSVLVSFVASLSVLLEGGSSLPSTSHLPPPASEGLENSATHASQNDLKSSQK